MPRFLLNTPQNLEEIKETITNTLNVTYGKAPASIVFVCGDAHAPGGGPGAALDLCNQLAGWIIENAFAPYCSERSCLGKISLHLECGNYPDDIRASLMRENIDHLRTLGLEDDNILGWEPIGFGVSTQISDLMSLPMMDNEQEKQVYQLIKKSNVYFHDLKEAWTLPVIQSLNDLGEAAPKDLETRLRALVGYQNALLAERINANMALAESINHSIEHKNRMFVHFVSVGNAHIVEGETIINGIGMTELHHCVGFSIGRVVN